MAAELIAKGFTINSTRGSHAGSVVVDQWGKMGDWCEFRLRYCRKGWPEGDLIGKKVRCLGIGTLAP